VYRLEGEGHDPGLEPLVQSEHFQNEDHDHDHANNVENAAHPSLLSQPAWKAGHPAGPRLVTIVS